MKHTRRFIFTTVALIMLSVTLVIKPWAAPPSSADADVRGAWQRAQQIGAYRYAAEIVQTTRPQPVLENVGASSRQDRLYVEGETDLQQKMMQFKLWSGDGHIGAENNSLQVRVTDGKTLGKVGAGEWKPVDNVSEVFAPGNDALEYLTGAKDIARIGEETRAGVSFTRYTFQVDGPAFAEHIRAQLEEQLSREGKLPAGLTLETARLYTDMTGEGEIWLDADGLPLRQTIRLVFPPNGHEQVEATIKTDFSRWGEGAIAATGISGFLAFSPQALQRAVLTISLSAGVAGLMALLFAQRKSKKVYAGLALTVIASLVIAPPLQAQQISTFYSDQKAQQVSAGQAQADVQAQRDLQKQLAGPTFDPHRSPLAQSATTAPSSAATSPLGLVNQSGLADVNLPVPINSASGLAQTTSTSVDTDHDGLTDDVEMQLGTQIDRADTDGDGLSDGIEVIELGTNPLDIDTDGDHISDGTEVRGFVDNAARHWYLNPGEADTNHDGTADTLECFDLTDVQDRNGQTVLMPSSGTQCADTDGDGTPDVFDQDDDGDGVPDSIDLSRGTAMGGGRAAGANGPVLGFNQQTMQFQLNHLQVNQPVFMDLQFRPMDVSHLWYTLNVLDWPSGDKDGQIQRVFDTTFKDVNDAHGQASGPKDANGDLRLIPMLEIEIPFQAGHYGNLPVKPGAPAITASTPITAWLDTAQTDSFQITVRKKDETGALLVYVPVNLVRDPNGNTPVAFSARMFYRPNSDSFGSAQRARLAWVVEALTDYCTPVPDDFHPGEDNRHDTWCADNSHWAQDPPHIIHTYYDDWYLTGMAVREDHGLSVGVVMENPDVPDRDPNYERHLWNVARGLDRTFLAGRPDFNVSEIKRRFDITSTATITERWGISTTLPALFVQTYSFPDQTYIATLPMTYTKQILNLHAPNGVNQAGQPISPTLLFAREEHYRSANLELSNDVVNTGSSITDRGIISSTVLQLDLDPAQIKEQVLAGVNWAPYRYRNGAWESYPIDEYWNLIATRYRAVFRDEQPSDPDGYMLAGRVVFAQSFYLSLYRGASGIVQIGQLPLTTPSAATDTILASIKDYAGKPGTPANEVVKIITQEIASHYRAKLTPLTREEKIWLFAGGGTEGLKGKWQNFKDLTTSGKVGIGLAVGGAAVAVGLLIVASAHLDFKSSQEVVFYVLDNINLVMQVKGFVEAIRDVGRAANSTQGLLNSIKSTSISLKSAANIAAIVGLVITVALAIGVFVAQIVLTGTQFGSLAFDQALAGVIATIIVAVLLFAIGLIPVVGPLIVAIIGLIDALVVLICKITGWDKSTNAAVKDWGACEGISGVLARVIQFLIYSQNPLVNLQAANRMSVGSFSIALQDNPVKGFQVGNKIKFSAVVTSTLVKNKPNSGLAYLYAWQYGDDYLKQAQFDYQFVNTEQDIHGSLSTDTPNNWLSTGQSGDARFYTVATPASGFDFTLSQSGINQKVSAGPYLAEGHAIKAQECWLLPNLVPVCYLRDQKDTLHVSLADNVKFDVFPATIGNFGSLVSTGNGYTLAWGQSGAVTFPVQHDADGDGLRSAAFGGNDPNDSLADTDQDGLDDFAETQRGTDPSQADRDHDGLSDYQELLAGTDPYTADTDHDGLLDGEEVYHYAAALQQWVGGWEIVYAFDDQNQPLFTRVTSDPLQPDTDGDGISDKLEYVYGFNPHVSSPLNVLSLNSALNDPDGLVKPGDTIAYTATIKNELRDRYALGLFEVTAPPVIQAQALVPKPYRLAPNEQATISGNVAVSALAQSQDISLTTTAGAIIANLRQVADGRQLWLSFNENPNATRFIDNSLLGNHATCLGSTCPVSGEAGYSGRGLRFDGVDDRLTAPVNVSEDSYTLSLWFKSTCSNCGLFSTVNTTTGAHDRDVYLKFGDVCALVNGNEICSPESIKYNDGNWHNVIHTFGGVQGNQQLFVDGVQRISSYASSTPFNQDNAVYIGYSAQVISPPNPWNGYLNGSIDEVEVYPRALSNPEIEARFKAPIFYAKFDESAGSLHFADASAFHHSMYCTAVLSRCPTAGQSGPQGKAVSFNHRQNLAVEENDGLNLNRGDGHFSLVAWISPAASDGGRQVIMGADAGPNDRQRYPTLYLQGNQLTLSFGDGNSICNAPSGSILAFGQWQHVAVTFDGTNVTFFVNKQAVASSAACAGKKPYPTKWFEIGRANDDATIFFMHVNIEDEGDGPGSAEYSLIFNRHEIWTQDKIWENTTRLINKEATIMGDGGNRFILCETDEDGHRDDCSGSNDINVDRTIYNTSIGDDSQSYNNDGRGTLYWRIWNEFYSGELDELRIYDYALDQDEVTDLYDNTARGLEIRLDETPGADIFYDTSGNNLNGVCAGTTCPVTGVAGRSNQAATFDGVNDYIDVPADIPETDYTLSLWFKTACNNCGLASADAGTLGSHGSDRNLFLNGGNLCAYVASSQTICSTGTNFADDRWHQVVHVMGTTVGGQKLYVDGIERASGNKAQSNFTQQTGLNLGFANNATQRYLQGSLDQVTIIRRALSASEVAALNQEVPVLNLHLDDPLNTTTFKNEANLGNNGTCSGNACARSTAKGQIRQSAVFDGVDDQITVGNEEALRLWDFSVGLWVKPEQMKTGPQPLIVKETTTGGNRNYGLFIEPNSMKVQASYNNGSFQVISMTSSGSLIQNQWNHVLMTFTGGRFALYLNGTLDTFGDFPGTTPLKNQEPLKLGREVSAYTPFAGQLDEVVIYGRALRPRDVKELYDYQASWFDVSFAHDLTIDADTPSAGLALNTAYLPQRDVVMAIQANDATSNIDRVEYSVNNGPWQLATRDINAWAFTFMPSAEGQYTIQTRATDRVGHVSPISSTTFIVDGSRPLVSLDATSTQQTLPAYANGSASYWTITLTGGVLDPKPSNNAIGSGVDSLYVELLTADGALIGDRQLATIAGDRWQMLYTLPFQPNGRYIVRLEATDKVGNITSRADEVIGIDSAAPLADLDFTNVSTTTLIGLGTNTPILHGTAQDIPYPTNRALHLHLDEAAEATSFADGSTLHLTAVCAGVSCPTAGEPGQAGQAVRFDGNHNYLTLDQLNMASGDYTLLAWFKTKAATQQTILAATNRVDDQPGLRLDLGADGRLSYLQRAPTGSSGGTTITSTLAYNDGAWHLAAAIRNGSALALSVDGQVVMTGTVNAGFTTPLDLTLGRAGRTQPIGYFNGWLDEVVVYDRALTIDQIRSIARPEVAGIRSVQLSFRHLKGSMLGDELALDLPFEEAAGTTIFGDLSLNLHSGTCAGAACPTAGVAGQIGRAAQFDGSNDVVQLNSFDLNGSFTLAAWINPAALGGTHDILSHGPNGAYLRTSGNFMVFSAGNSGNTAYPITPNQWTHVAGVFNGTEWKLYVNGLLVATTQNNQGDAGIAQPWAIGANSAGTADFFNGSIDEVAIYRRALNADEISVLADPLLWREAALAQPGAGSTTWSYHIPEGIEGPYQIDLRTSDSFGHVTALPNLWRGEVDTAAPHIQLDTFPGNQYSMYYRCSATDYNLSEQGFECPTACLQPVYQDAAWYTSIFSATKLYRLASACTAPRFNFQGPYNLTACDLYGQCSTTTYTPTVASLLAPQAVQASPINTLILTPTAQSVFTTIAPIDIAGYASSPNFLRALTVTVDGVPLPTTTWANGVLTETTWSTSWTPGSEKAYQIDALASDWAGNVTTGTLFAPTVYVDTTAPQISLTTNGINTGNFNSSGYVALRGLVTETVGLQQLQVKLNAGAWTDAPIITGTSVWTATIFSGSLIPPTNQTYTLAARATDVAGRIAEVTRTVMADAVPPSTFTATLAYTNSLNVLTVITPGATVRDVQAPTLHLSWTPSSDASGLARYLAGWTTGPTSTAGLTTHTSAETAHAQTVGEAQRLYARVIAEDNAGNQTAQTLGPIYTDFATTPDFIAMDGAGTPYSGWLTGSCNLIGVDRHMAQQVAQGGTLVPDQKFYATWDSQALRLAWTGADWSGNGDLFIYLDTQAGGTNRAYDPFAATVTNTVIYLPGVTPLSPANAMLADFVIWVQDAQTAQLLHWNGSAWVLDATLADSQYRFAATQRNGQTDLYLPFGLLGISDPTATSLRLVALATEENALRVWAAQPSANPVNSARVVATTDYAGSQQTFALHQDYRWTSLGAGLCANGTDVYRDTDVQIKLTANPAGTIYSFVGDGLFWLWSLLLGNKPADASQTFTFMDTQHSLLRDGQLISYTLQYQNKGTDTANNVRVDLTARFGLRLPAGDLPDFTHQLVTLGNLAPGQSGTVVVRGQINSQAGTQRWASLEARIFDNAHPESGAPLDWIWSDHQVDGAAPQFFGLSQPDYLISRDDNALRGYAYDESGVPTLTLQITTPAAGVTSLVCPAGTSDDGQWSCNMNATAINGSSPNDGDQFIVRTQAIDAFGQASSLASEQPITLTVDAIPPAITLSLTASQVTSGTILNAPDYALSGGVFDNRGLRSVTVCVDGECQLAKTQLDTHPAQFMYEDVPASPLPITALTTCGGGEIVRQFVVTDTFPMWDVSLGLNIAHTLRNDVRVELKSPSGVPVRVLDSDGSSTNISQNYDVLLSDSAESGLSSRSNDDITAPYFDRQVRPYQPLRAFQGTSSAGTWTLTICDTAPAQNNGAYQRSRLVLTPQSSAVNAQTGQWSFNGSVPSNVDYTAHAVSIFGTDLVGNVTAPQMAFTFGVDSVAPIITVTTLPTGPVMLNDPLLLSGLVSDGGEIAAMSLSVVDPEGAQWSDFVDHVGTTWSYTDTTRFTLVGTYAVWIEAIDRAGNRNSVGPYALTFTSPPVPSRLYLPLVAKNAAPQQPAPDIVLDSASIVTGTTTITLTNAGSVNTPSGFRVDLYFDPANVPTVTVTWPPVSTYGAHWLVPAGLAPGQRMILTLATAASGNYPPQLSGLSEAYIQLDTLNQVQELHELYQGFYNNIIGITLP